MNLCQGRIGKQEGASLAGIALVSSAVFVLDIGETYRYGNGTYIAFPGAIFLAFMLFLLLAEATRISGKKDLIELVDYTVGKFAGNLFVALMCVLLLVNAYCLLSRFSTMVHALIYMKTTPFPVLLWIVPVVVYIAFHGFECVARMAKCFGLLLGVALLLELLIPMRGYEVYRLFPLPTEHFDTIAADAFSGMFATGPALLALLGMARGLQGVQSTKSAGTIGALISIALVALTQLAIGLTYTSTELKNIFVPLYRLNLKLVQESYFFRLDKLALFAWLIGAIIASAYYLYGGASLFCRRWSRYDIRPAVIALGVILLCVLAAERAWQYDMVQTAFSFVQRYGSWMLVVPFSAIAVIALIKTHFMKRRHMNEMV